MKYIHKIEIIDAFRYDGDLINSDGNFRVPDWAESAYKEGRLYYKSLSSSEPPELFIKNYDYDNDVYVCADDYVVLDGNTIYRLSKDVFEALYEPIQSYVDILPVMRIGIQQDDGHQYIPLGEYEQDIKELYGKYNDRGREIAALRNYIANHNETDKYDLPKTLLPGKDIPIDIFDSQEQLDASLKEWQHRLYLDGWIIRAKLVDKLDDENAVGINNFVVESSIADIEILSRKGINKFKDEPIRICQECALVHELLHTLYGWMCTDEDAAYESVYLQRMEHQRLDMMAKSLIMAKYNLDYDYFIKEGDNENP